jgi:hypothetical protein
MGAALIRKCWDVEEEKWAGHDYYDNESIDDSSYWNYQYENQLKYNLNIKRQSI